MCGNSLPCLSPTFFSERLSLSVLLFLLPTMPRSGSFAACGQVECLGHMGPLPRFAFQERKPQEVVLHPEA